MTILGVLIQIQTKLHSYWTFVQAIMLKFISVALLLGVVSAAPSGVYPARFGESPASTFHAAHIAPLSYIPAPAPLTYAEPTTLTKYESISSPLTYTASHQPAVALSNLAPVPLGYAGYSIRYNGHGYAY